MELWLWQVDLLEEPNTTSPKRDLKATQESRRHVAQVNTPAIGFRVQEHQLQSVVAQRGSHGPDKTLLSVRILETWYQKSCTSQNLQSRILSPGLSVLVDVQVTHRHDQSLIHLLWMRFQLDVLVHNPITPLMRTSFLPNGGISW